MAQPLILVTNDDGIYSPGLHAVIEAVAPLGEVIAVAPKVQQTSMGRAVAHGLDGMTIEQVVLPLPPSVAYTAYAVSASPALAAAYGILHLATRMPDLCVSGINYGENIGATVTSSGTVGAALEASSLGVPALAMSLELPPGVFNAHDYSEMDWSAAGYFTHFFAKRILEQHLPDAVSVLNVNVPTTATPQTPYRLTRQSALLYYQWSKKDSRDVAVPPRLFKKIILPEAANWNEDDDVTAFARDHIVSVTPLSWNLTAETTQPWWMHESAATD